MKERRVGVLLRLKVVNGDALEIGNDEVARCFLSASAAGECAHVFHALRVRFAEVFARALVLGEQRARPEKVNVAPIAGQLFYRLLKTGDGAALDAEDIEKRIPKRFRFGILARFALPFFRETDGAVFDFIPREGHRGGSKLSAGKSNARRFDEGESDASCTQLVELSLRFVAVFQWKFRVPRRAPCVATFEFIEALYPHRLSGLA